MGNGSSTNAKTGSSLPHLATKDIHFYVIEYEMTPAEIYYCWIRFNDLLYLESKSTSVAGNTNSGVGGGGTDQKVVPASQKKTSATAEAETAAMNGITRTLGLSEQMKLDWLLSRVYVSMFPSEGVSDITFGKYLKAIAWWRRRTVQNKIEFLFDLLDYDQDGSITFSDLTVFIQQLLHYQFKIGDIVSIRHDSRTGILRHLDETDFSPGIWAGIELYSPLGKNNGSVKGIKYFECEENHGVFVPFENLELMGHREMAQDIILQIVPGKDSGVGIDVKEFTDHLQNDSWLNTLLAHDILPSALRA